jgi:hypothetical protein
MALAKAIVAGAIAALAIPYATRGGTGALVERIQYGLVSFDIGSYHFAWSWPLFCIVTLFAWAMLAWAER